MIALPNAAAAAPPFVPSFFKAPRVFGLVAALALSLCAVTTVAVLNARVDWQVEVTGHSFGISDLFPRWYGAKAMLAGTNPYSEDFRDDLVRQYYGQLVTREWERDTFRTICEFFYPPFVVIPLAPLLALPFELARPIASGVLAAAIAIATLLWVRYLGAPLTPARAAAVAALSLVFYPSLDAILLQQLTALVYLYVVAAVVLAANRRHAVAGLLLALAMVKPQSAIIPGAALLFWAVWDRRRWHLLAAFAAAMAVQLAVAQLLVPGWLGEFLAANARYREFNTIGYWLPGKLLGGDLPGVLVGVVPLVAFLAWHWWHARSRDLASPPTARLVALTFAASVILMPDISYYNKVFLIPAIAGAVFTPLASGRHARVARRLAALALSLGAVFLLAVGAAIAIGGVDNTLAGASGPHFVLLAVFLVMLPVFVLPSTITEYLGARK